MALESQVKMRETPCVVMVRILRMKMPERRLQRRGK